LPSVLGRGLRRLASALRAEPVSCICVELHVVDGLAVSGCAAVQVEGLCAIMCLLFFLTNLLIQEDFCRAGNLGGYINIVIMKITFARRGT
jgi:hypothetical protein